MGTLMLIIFFIGISMVVLRYLLEPSTKIFEPDVEIPEELFEKQSTLEFETCWYSENLILVKFRYKGNWYYINDIDSDSKGFHFETPMVRRISNSPKELSRDFKTIGDCIKHNQKIRKKVVKSNKKYYVDR